MRSASPTRYSSSMASPTATILVRPAASSSSSRRTRLIESAMGGEDKHPAHPLPPSGSAGRTDRPALSTDAHALSELILNLNARAKSSFLGIQEYFTLAWNSLRL